MAKLPDPLGSLTPEAKTIYDKITAKRGQMRGGPYASLMHHPALAEKVGDLGAYLRFGGTLPGDIRELAILITARSIKPTSGWPTRGSRGTRSFPTTSSSGCGRGATSR